MKQSLRQAAIAMALSVLMVTAAPASAADFKGEGFYAHFGPSMATDVRGLVVGDRQGGDSPRLTVGLLGLVPHVEFTIVGRSIGCGGTPGQGNRLFKIEAMADDGGDAFLTRIMAEWSRLDLRSIWGDWGDGAACVLSLNYSKIELDSVIPNGDAALGLTKVGAGTLLMLVEKKPNGKARVTIVADGFSGSDVFRFTGVNKGCGKNPTQSSFTIEFTEGRVSNFKSKTVNMTQNQLDALRSVRIRNVTDGANVGCAPLSIIAVLIG